MKYKLILLAVSLVVVVVFFALPKTQKEAPTVDLDLASNDDMKEVDTFILHQRTGKDFELIRFENGINKVDLFGKGVKKDLVIASQRNNGTSPHSYTSYSFFGGGLSVGKQYLSLIQLADKDDSNQLEDNISTWEGADCMLRDIGLIKTKGLKPLLVVAHRDLGESFVDAQKVRFDYYQLKHNDEMDYMPDDWFQYIDSSETKEKYCDVNEAFEKELKLVF